MPQLNTVIEIGFCSGYGEGDYRVSCCSLTRDELNELIVTTCILFFITVKGFIRAVSATAPQDEEKSKVVRDGA